MPRWKKQGFSNKSNQYKTNSQLLATQWTGRRTTDDHNYCENSPVIRQIDTDDAEVIHVHNHDGLTFVPEPAGSDVSISFSDLENFRYCFRRYI